MINKILTAFVLGLVTFLTSSVSLAQGVCPKCGRVHNNTLASVSVGPYQIALQSAQYRAANGIKGHAMHIERGHKVGVGWSTHNPSPATCFWNERAKGQYVSVRGRDGWYSTLVF